MSELQHKFVETNGIRMHYVEQGTGPLVVLCHGWPESWYSHRHQIPALADAGFYLMCVPRAVGGLEVDFNLRNTGKADSDDVPQVYLSAPSDIPDGVQFPELSAAARSLAQAQQAMTRGDYREAVDKDGFHVFVPVEKTIWGNLVPK